MSLPPAGKLEVLMAKAAAWLEVRIALAALKRGDPGPLNRSLVAGWMESDPVLAGRLESMSSHELTRALRESRFSFVPAAAMHSEGLGPGRGGRGSSSCAAEQQPFASSL